MRTSLEAALSDARRVVDRDDEGVINDPDRSRAWIGACGYLMIIDQLSTVYVGGYIELLTSDLGGLSLDDSSAIYALRNAFIHGYGLANEPPSYLKDGDRARRRHVFGLTVGSPELVTLGDRADVLAKALHDLPPTTVDLIRLGDTVEMIVARIRHLHEHRQHLPVQHTDVRGFLGAYTFRHQDAI